MFKQILYTHWKWGGVIALCAALVGFAIPVASVQALGSTATNRWEVSALMGSVQSWGYFYMLLALSAGLTLALTGWAADQQGRHVYALSLPLPRWQYVLFRFEAGALLLAPAALGVWIGGLVASVSITLPVGLHAYPTTLAFRFALATLLIYSIAFAAASGSRRTGVWIVSTFGGVMVAQVVLKLVTERFDLMEWIFTRLAEWPGPLEVLMSAWMLINV
jgi:hypothetical protein